MSELFYLQDSRNYCGNDLYWWAKDHHGYTTDLSRAHVFTKEEAIRLHNDRCTDIPWPKDYIDGKTRPAVDCQHVDREVALAGTGIVLRKPERPKAEAIRCEGCKRFISEAQKYGPPCSHCGTSNRP